MAMLYLQQGLQSMNTQCHFYVSMWLASVFALSELLASAADWPMLGRDGTRNSVSPNGNPPLDWALPKVDVTGRLQSWETERWNEDKVRNVRWKSKLGTMTYGSPIVADGKVYIGTNDASRLKPYSSHEVRAGALLCFRESDGKFLWQFSARELATTYYRFYNSGLGASPLVEGKRLWFVSNRCEMICLDTEGFHDGKDDGVKESGVTPADKQEADVVWRFDMVKELGVYQQSFILGPHRHGSPASFRNRVYVVTGNGTDRENRIKAPKTPSLVCFDKDTGKVLWTDASPGENILHGTVSDPLVVEIEGHGQVIVGQADGWLRSFDALTGELIWKFDFNKKESKWRHRGDRSTILATAVFYKGRVYVGSGRDCENGIGQGRLVCIDPKRKGDISSELAVDAEGRAIPHRRLQAVLPEKGEKAIPNPNSGLIWDYTAVDQNKDNKLEWDEAFHRTMSSVAIKNNLLVAADYEGLVHCFDADTGKRHWACDAANEIVAAPLIVEDIVYVASADGKVLIFRLSPDPKQAMKKTDDGKWSPLVEIDMTHTVYSPPTFANGVLYIATRHHLWAIAAPQDK